MFGWFRKRAENRAGKTVGHPLHAVRASRFLDAAKQDHLQGGWGSVNYSMDAILRSQLARVRARSRYLAVNDPYVHKFLGLCQENIVGPDGIRLQMRVIENVDADGSIVFDERANRLIEDAWQQWGKRQHCSYNRQDSFLSIQNMVVRSVAQDGEIFVRKRRGGNQRFGLSLELIEADHVPITHNEDLGGGRRIRLGIEYDSNNRVVAYHVTEKHPGDAMLGAEGRQRTMRIPAEQMLHAFVRERPSQSRGIPWAISTMARSKMLDGYEQAELVAARAGASKMGFILEKEGETYVGDDKGVDAQGNEVTLTDFDAGTLERLPGGLDIKLFDPQHPTTAFESFTKRILRGIGSGLGVGYSGRMDGKGKPGGIIEGTGVLSSVGDFFSNTFGGFFADGGHFRGGKPIVVGERGPEIIMPKSGGQVIPNEAMNDDRPVQVTMNVSTPDANSFRASQSQITTDMANAIEVARRRHM